VKSAALLNSYKPMPQMETIPIGERESPCVLDATLMNTPMCQEIFSSLGHTSPIGLILALTLLPNN